MKTLFLQHLFPIQLFSLCVIHWQYFCSLRTYRLSVSELNKLINDQSSVIIKNISIMIVNAICYFAHRSSGLRYGTQVIFFNAIGLIANFNFFLILCQSKSILDNNTIFHNGDNFSIPICIRIKKFKCDTSSLLHINTFTHIIK